VGVVEDGGERFAGMVEGESLLDEFAFAGEGGVLELDADGVAEDFDGVGVGVQGSRDGGDEVLVFGELLERVFDDGLSGSGDAEDEADWRWARTCASAGRRNAAAADVGGGPRFKSAVRIALWAR
jgi:hypothetical protein